MLLNIGICISLILVLFITAISFYTKEKMPKKENTIFGTMIIVTIIGLVIETIIYYNAIYFENVEIDKFILFIKLLYVYYCIWMYFFVIYNLVVFNRLSKLKEIVLIGTYMVFIFLSLILPIRIELNSIYIYPTGSNTIAQYIFFMMGMSFILINSLKNIKMYKSRKTIPLISCFILGIFSTIIQYIHHEYLFIVPSHAVALILMYFTIENPDLKIIEELKKNRSLTSKSYIEKSNFLFRMSAEVRKPIENIKELNDYNLDSDNLKEIKENSKGIDLNLRNANFTINNVLDVTSLDTKNINITNNKYNIYKLLKEIKLRESKKINNIRFDFNISENIPEYLYGDSIRLKNILMCILDKSIERTNTGFIEVNVNSINKYDICRLIITIEDSSLPLSLEEINNILDNDKEIDENNITIYDINKLINMMNGNLMIKSEEGNEFLLSIDSKILNPKTEEITNDTDILFISNNNKLLKNLEILFNEYTSNSVLNGVDAIDLIRAGENYNLILIDDVMKPISGLETLKKLRSLDINIPCIIMLDNDKEHIKNHYIKDGFIDYILKDDLKNEINRIIKKML